MSHFTVLVVGENIEDQLAPFDENISLPRYREATKEELIAKGKREIEEYKNGLYARFLKDPDEYKANCHNSGHIEYLEKEFPEKLKWNDNQIHQDQLRWYEPGDIGPDGEVYSTYNPNSKWDWWVLGGRWSGLIKLKDGATGVIGQAGTFGNETGIDQAKIGDIANLDEITTFAVLKDGKWYEKGEMGWWGIAHNEKDEEEWNNQFKKLLSDLPADTTISIIDCHI